MFQGPVFITGFLFITYIDKFAVINPVYGRNHSMPARKRVTGELLDMNMYYIDFEPAKIKFIETTTPDKNEKERS